MKLFLLNPYSGYFAQLIKDELKYLGPIDLMQYFVKSFSMHDEDVHLQHDNRGIQVDFVFGRRFLNHGLTEFLPPIIICVVSFCTCYFKVEQIELYLLQFDVIFSHFQHVDFDASMTVNVTLMLCMVTVFTSMLNSLPKTSSVKMIDVWVVFNLMVPFFEIILQTLLYKLGDDGNGREEVDFFDGKTLGKPNEQPNDKTGKRFQAKDKHDDENDGTTNNKEKCNDVTERDGEMERRKRKLTKKASWRYLLVNIIKFVLPGVYTLFCFVFFLIGLLLAGCKQTI